MPAWIGPFRFAYERCAVDKPFVYNRLFTTLRGREWFIEGRLSFPEDPFPPLFPNRYRTMFGFGHFHRAKIYDKTAYNLSKGLERLTRSREPQIVGFHESLFSKQTNFINAHHSFYHHLSFLFTPTFLEYTDAVNECELHYADPHDKREMRINGYNDLLGTGLLVLTDNWVRRHRVTCKLKEDEFAKTGSYPRVIVDMGVEASLFGFRITDFMKRAMAQSYRFRDGHFMFVKSPTFDSLTMVFNLLLNPPGKYFFAFFSDDSCLSIRLDGKVHIFNVDIKSCDSSHGRSVFDALAWATPECARNDMLTLITQCSSDLQIVCPHNNRQKVVLRPSRPVLFSGATITTSINNIACLTILVSVLESHFDGTEACLASAALNCGYQVTTERCILPQDIQFLKHSPVIDTAGVLRPMLNIGVLLRLSGVCRGDLPGRGDLRVRAEQFQYSLLQGCYPRVSFRLLSNMYAATGQPTPPPVIRDAVAKLLAFRVSHSSTDVAYAVTPSECYLRYRLTPFQIEEIDESFGNCRYGQQVFTSAGAKILLKDYSYEIED